MSEILLVHGACFGAWCWERVIPELRALGHAARAIDLPGREADASLADQAEAIVAELRGPTILVGHSAGGFAITAAAEASDLVTGLIYLCAYVPVAGMSLAEMRRAGPSQPMTGAFVVDPAAGLFGFDPTRARALFFDACEDASARLVQQAMAPMETALPSVARAKTLPRGAIICSTDRAVPPAYQRQMAAGMVQVEQPWGHAPFLQDPVGLAAEIDRMLRAWG
ncbi:MAG: alpha/beta fold hydrolase [Cypionkella sp.]